MPSADAPCCTDPGDARDRLALFRDRYNTVRPHWALRVRAGADPLTPCDVYCRGAVVEIPAWQPWAREARKKLDALMEQDAEGAAA